MMILQRNMPMMPRRFTHLFFAFLLLCCLVMAQKSALAACLSSQEGHVVYNNTANVMQYCDGSNWIAMHKPGGAGTNCTAPVAPEGSIVFNSEYRVNMACAGGSWQAMGPYYDPGVYVMGANIGAKYTNIDSKSTKTCALRNDRTLWCWGAGQFGVAGVSQSSSPVAVAEGEEWLKINGNCGMKTDHTMWCWGEVISGPSSILPAVIDSGNTIIDFAHHGYALCHIRTDGSLWCQGNRNPNGGGNALTQEETGQTWKKLVLNNSGADARVCAIRHDDRLFCWGDALGTTPTELISGSTWKALFSGQGLCAIRSDGVENDTAWCWGTGLSGANSSVPQKVDNNTWLRVEPGDRYLLCGLRTDGTIWCRGYNNLGQLGNGTYTNSTNTWVQVMPGITWVDVSAGGDTSDGTSKDAFACGIQTNGAYYCWGDNRRAQLGNSTVMTNPSSPTKIKSDDVFTAISSGGMSNGPVCAIRTDGALLCWGSRPLGLGASVSNTDTPTEVVGGGVWKKISVGLGYNNQNYACGIKQNNTLWCWGDDQWGQLGNGTVTTAYQHAPIQIGSDQWKFVAAGGGYSTNAKTTCGIKMDDSLWCWGGGRLGGGDNSISSDIPVAVLPGATWRSISINSGSVCAIRTDRTLWCWGSNDYNQIGLIGGGSVAVPTQIGTESNWDQITVFFRHSMGIKTNGDRWILGSGSSPAPLSKASETYKWRKLVNSGWNGEWAGIQTDGTLWLDDDGWKMVDSGQWSDIATSNGTYCGIKDDGFAYCLGTYTSSLALDYGIGDFSSGIPLIGDCAVPPTPAGGIRYSSHAHVAAFCNGVEFQAIGK